MVTGATRARARTRRRGLTLLELLIALALASLVMLLAGGSLRTTVRLVGDAHVDGQRGSRDARVLTLLTAQIGWIRVSNEGQAARFVGRPDALEMETLVSARRPDRREPVAARYRIEWEKDEARLVYEENAGPKGPGSDQGRTLLTGLSEARFEYLFYEAGVGASWREEWAAVTLPRAVRLTMTKGKGEPITWLIPVVATF